MKILLGFYIFLPVCFTKELNTRMNLFNIKNLTISKTPFQNQALNYLKFQKYISTLLFLKR